MTVRLARLENIPEIDETKVGAKRADLDDILVHAAFGYLDLKPCWRKIRFHQQFEQAL